jgi:Transglycosylase SLT domain/SPOR domain
VQVVTRFCIVLLLTLSAALVLAQEPTLNEALDRAEPPEKATAPEKASPPLSSSAESICLMVEAAARANGLPVDFFARVIWQESHFRPDEVGPQTRSGDRAEGIAQFMPRTAQERRLLDPFDPVQALPKSAEFLRDLRQQFGNLGLAAAAYNAGPQRVRDWMAGKRTIPAETRHYVAAITGRSIDEWMPVRDVQPDQKQVDRPVSDCRQLMALLKQQPNLFVGALMRRVELGVAAPWGVQLSAGFSRDQALNTFEGLAKRYSAILNGSDPMIVRSIFRSRGTHPFYQVRIGAPTRADANALCTRIQRAGGACLVLRNLPT